MIAHQPANGSLTINATTEGEKDAIRQRASLIGKRLGEVAADLISELLLAMISSRTQVAPSHLNAIVAPPRQSSILTASEVADILRISKSKAYRMIQQGEIPAVHFDRTTRVRRQDLDEFVLGHMK